MSRAWEKWQFSYLQGLREFELLRRAVKKMLHRQLSMAFNTWRDGADMSGRQMRLMTGALNRMRNLALSRAWEQWQYAYEEQIRQMELLRRALAKMMRAKMLKAFNTWRYGAGLSSEHERLMRAALARMMQVKMSQAWEQWQAWYDEYLRQQKLLHQFALRMIKRQMYAAFHTWRDEGKRGWKSKLYDGKAIRFWKKLYERWLKKAFNMAFVDWRTWVANIPRDMEVQADIPSADVTDLQDLIVKLTGEKEQLSSALKNSLASGRKGENTFVFVCSGESGLS